MQKHKTSARSESAIPKSLEAFDRLPDSARVRIDVVAGLLGCSVATAWRRAKSGAIPAPIKDGNITSWPVGPLRQALAKSAGAQ